MYAAEWSSSGAITQLVKAGTDLNLQNKVYMYDLIIHEMLRKKDKATEHNRKTKQHNTTRPRQLFFKEKTASGGIRTHDRPLARRSSYQLSYRGSSVGWARITYTIQSNQSNSSITNQINW